MIEQITPKIFHLLSKFIAQAPYFYSLSIYSEDTQKMIEQLKALIPLNKSKRITYFAFDMPIHFHNYHNTFFVELSQVLPNLRTMKLAWTTPFFTANPTTLTEVIKDLKKYFPRLVYLIFLLAHRTGNQRDTIQNYKKNLKKSRLYKNNEVYYRFGHYYTTHDCLKIWL